MKKYFSIYFFLILSTLVFSDAKSKIENVIIVKVGNKIITSYDVKYKILSTLLINNNEINQKNINGLKNRTLDKLIIQKLKQIELEKVNIKFDNRKVNSYINSITSNDPESLKKKFKDYDLNLDLLLKDIETDLKWQQFIYNKYSKKIEIDQNIINEEMKKIIKTGLNINEINLSEIEVLSSSDKNDKIIFDILEQIKNNGFDETAQKFSISTSSINKGSLGWINEKLLSKKIFNEIKDLKSGQITKPIIQPKSILFLKLNSKRQIQKNNIDKNELENKLIKQKQNEIFNLYSKNYLSKLKNNYLIEYK